MTSETTETATINLPGAFCGWFDGTSLVQGKDDDDPECKATRLAYKQGRHVKAGSGYSVRVTATSTVLRLLVEYGAYCEDVNQDVDVSERSEVRAAGLVIKRARAALKVLGG